MSNNNGKEIEFPFKSLVEDTVTKFGSNPLIGILVIFPSLLVVLSILIFPLSILMNGAIRWNTTKLSLLNLDKMSAIFNDFLNGSTTNEVTHTYLFDNLINSAPIVFCIFIIFASYTIYLINKNKRVKEAYKSSKNFIGLYNSADMTNIDQSKLIPRDKEIEFILKIIGESKKKVTFLIGDSGCGKSTIIFYLNKYIEEQKLYDIIDITAGEGKGLSQIDDKLAKRQDTKILCICDQMEKFFLFEPQEDPKKDIQGVENKKINDLISYINNNKDVHFLFVMRSEYFPTALSYIQNKASKIGGDLTYTSTPLAMPNIIFLRKNDIFYNQEYIQETFSRYGTQLYDIFEQSKLIEKQIIFNILENEIGTKYFENLILISESYQFCRNNTLTKYYDRQLYSTGDYWTSARIMYLLSKASSYGKVYTREAIQKCIFDEDGEKVETCINRLIDCFLVKKTKNAAAGGVVVAHDYISETYLEYANRQLESKVRDGLDNFIYRYSTVDAKKENKKLNNPDSNDLNLFERLLSCATFLICFILLSIQTKNSDFPTIIIPCIAISAIYVYLMYFNIIKFFYNRIIGTIIVSVLSLVVCCTFAFYHAWLIIAGIMDSLILGLPFIIFALNKKLAKSAKEHFLHYGYRFTAMGIAVAFVAIILYKNTVIEIALLSSLLIFGYLMHLNKKFFYICRTMIMNTD